MDRGESLKSLWIGGVAGVTLGASACKTPEEVAASVTSLGDYGRTDAEKAHDQKILNEQFFRTHELETIATLCDIILPATATAGSANDARVPEFIEFMVKDLPYQQVPMRGGLMWLDGESNRRYNMQFKDCAHSDQIAIIEDIAYPDPEGKRPELSQGIKFFTMIRNLTLTGYYTTKMGFDDLGYVGNRPNLWDGVPEDVLKQHNMSYDPEWIAKCINHDTREAIAEWDEHGNLLN